MPKYIVLLWIMACNIACSSVVSTPVAPEPIDECHNPTIYMAVGDYLCLANPLSRTKMKVVISYSTCQACYLVTCHADADPTYLNCSCK